MDFQVQVRPAHCCQPIEPNTTPLIADTKSEFLVVLYCLITHVTSLSRARPTFWWREGVTQPRSFQRVSQVSGPGALETRPFCLHRLSEASVRSRYAALFSSSWVHPLFCLKSSPQQLAVPSPQPAPLCYSAVSSLA